MGKTTRQARARHQVEVSNPEKLFWPGEGITKGDLAGYYRKVARWLLPHLQDRPHALHRQPNGITDRGFFQKNLRGGIPDWIETLTVEAESTGRPVRFEYTRELEFTSARSRHPQHIAYRAGVMQDGTLHALEMKIVEDTGAYGAHGLTVCTVSGFRGLSTYRSPHLRLEAKVVYTNKPVPGAFRGYGAPQALWALESFMEELQNILQRQAHRAVRRHGRPKSH